MSVLPPATFDEFITTNRVVRFLFKCWAVVAVIDVIGVPVYNVVHSTLGGSHPNIIDIVIGILLGFFFGGVLAGFLLFSGTLLVWLWWLLFVEKGTA